MDDRIKFSAFLRAAWLFYKDRSPDKYPKAPVPVTEITPALLQAAPDGTAWRLGHSSLLLKLENAFWLIDPVLSKRVSPLPFLGPKRFHQPPIKLRDLPPIKGVIVSHDHYDHLDYATIRALKDKAEHFITARGVGAIMQRWGVPAGKIIERDWWQGAEIGGVRLTCTPSQHFSGRGLKHRNETLWSSWVIEAGGLKIFYSGDTGYSGGFAEIGQRYGPFDAAFIECGAYDVNWPTVHMQPEETLRTFSDVRGRTLIPVHNGTFCLARHAWYEPLERISALASAANVSISTPQMGEPLNLHQPAPGSSWWRQSA